MLEINMEDVKNVLISCKPYLIFLGIVCVAAVAALIVCAVNKKLQKKTKYLIRTQAGVVALMAIILTANMIVTGPMYTLVSLAMGEGSISDASIESSSEFGVKVAEEGIVLLENDNLLPLEKNKTINVFGWASTNPCYGGSGSGGISDAYPTTSLLDGLKEAGFETNTELSEFYTAYNAQRPSVNMFAQDWTLPEPPVDQYSDELMQNAREFSDTAMVVLARTGCENADLPTDLTTVTYNNNSTDYEDFGSDRHYLELSRSEENMLNMVCENFDNVIVVYNGSSVFELGFAKEHEQIKSLIWCPGTGQTGFKALGEIIAGEVNPSGKTTDILVKDLEKAPSYNNFVVTMYDNMDEHGVANAFNPDELKAPSFSNYVEGIYVGYRFYETAAAEGFINYEDEVSYPFGYGLSYTSFEQKMGELTEDKEGNISVDVTVTNTGSVAGKEVVELYYNPPYTNGGIEKSSANLVAFDKTGLLGAGESETVTLTFTAEDMASYDTYNHGCYVLESGDYILSLQSDSHNVIDSRVYNVAEELVYDEHNPRSTDEVAATNQFDFAEGDATYLSRADGFANYAEATAKPVNKSMSDEAKAMYLDNTNYHPEDYNNDSDEMPVTGADNGIKLAELRGASYDDERWDLLLDELTVDEMDNLIALGGYQTAAIESIGKVATTDCDGPVDIYNNFTGVSSIGLPAVVMLAFTWNTDIATEYGECIASMADEMNVSGWYAPSMNMHRSAFAGRNFEYYSEDGFIAGKMAASVVQGSNKYGVYAYIKHFALNDQETDRWYKNSMWSNEQAIREIYLKPFEMAVKEGHATAVMSSYNYIGPVWSGACAPLQQTVLRDEWGFRGMVITDYFLAAGGAMNADQAIRNGSDMMLTNIEAGTNHVVDKTSATGILAMRNATHNILYTVVNSRAYDEENLHTGAPAWEITLIVIDIVLLALLVLLEVFVVRKGYNRRKDDTIQVIEKTE